MAEMWDISHYVEGHPDDYEQRWRLAKKLYMAWEYRLALEHLQVLRNEWDHRVNVVRYLAATYYRLGRYAEAITELESAIKLWPQEVGLNEQLARVKEISGDREGAAEVWEMVAELDPHHPIAEKSARRLREKIRENANNDLHLADSDDGIDLSPGQVCPTCGAQNSDEFDHCWQCHAVLPLVNGEGAPAKKNAPAQPVAPFVTPEAVQLVGGLCVMAVLSFGLYLSLMLALGQDSATDTPVHTLWGLYATEMVTSRLITGALMVLLWPLALWLAMIAVGIPRDLPNSWIGLTGLLVGGLGYLCSWVPGTGFLLVFIVPAVTSLAIILGIFRLPFPRALAVWAMQLLQMFVLMVASVVISESVQLKQFFNPVSELPAVARYAFDQGRAPNPGVHALPGQMVEDSLGTRWASEPLRWRSTGSRWMDRRAGAAQFIVTTETKPDATRFELSDSEGTKVFELVQESPYTMNYLVDTGETYTVFVQEPASRQVAVTASCLLLADW